MLSDDSDVGEIALRLGYQLRRLDMLAMNDLQDRMADLGVQPGRATALVFIGRNPGCDQTELGRVLDINRASTTSAVDGLVAMGAVERRPGRDRRSNALHLTANGRRLCGEVIQLTADHEADFFGSLTVDEREALFRLLVKARQGGNATARRATPTLRAISRRVK